MVVRGILFTKIDVAYVGIFILDGFLVLGWSWCRETLGHFDGVRGRCECNIIAFGRIEVYEFVTAYGEVADALGHEGIFDSHCARYFVARHRSLYVALGGVLLKLGGGNQSAAP